MKRLLLPVASPSRNAGEVPIVIYVSTLLTTGDPAAIPD